MWRKAAVPRRHFWLAMFATLTFLMPACAGLSDLEVGEQSPQEKQILIYSTVIRDHVSPTSRSKSQYGKVLLLDRVFKDAGSPEVFDFVFSEGRKGKEDIPTSSPLQKSVRHGIRARLADLVSIKFVSRVPEAIAEERTDGRIANNGVVLLLSPVSGTESRARVGFSSYSGNLASSSGTYYLERSGEKWHTTGKPDTDVVS